MKGDRKKTPTQFKKGCTPWNKGVSLSSTDPTDDSGPPESSRTVRMNKEEYYLVTQISRDGTSRAMPDCEGKSGSVRILRPTMPSTSDLKKEQVTRDTEGMRLVDNTKMVEAWNTAYELHRRDAPQCDVPQLELANEKKWGVCWKITLKCVKCCFQTPEFKLYKEVSTRNSAIKKCENSGIELSSRTKRALNAADRDADYHRNYSKRSDVVKHKLVVHSNKIQAYSEYKQTNKVKSDYKKGQLDPFPSSCAHGIDQKRLQ